MSALAAVHLRVLPTAPAVAGAHEQHARRAAMFRRFALDGAEQRAADLGRGLDLALVARATHRQICSFCLAHRFGRCRGRRDAERAITRLRRGFERAMRLLEDL
jgi:hypothetical protein